MLVDSLNTKYSKLEKSYFLLDKNFSQKTIQAEEIINVKREVLKKIKKKLDLYEQYDLNEVNNIHEISKLEFNILEVIVKVSKYKEKLVEEHLEKQKKKGQKLCVICMENPILILIKPCCHMCLCQICSLRVQNCPICRKFISIKEKINICEKSIIINY